MGTHAGFDIVPCLSKSDVDRQSWDKFIISIKKNYKDDAQVEIKSNYILFRAGEHPKLPFEGHKLLRFSSNISGTTAKSTEVESYIATVARIAQVHFGSRVQCWNECHDQYGSYDWKEVHESIRSYEQADDPGIPTSTAHFLPVSDPNDGVEIPLFEMKEIPGKGRGLVARFHISKGTRILCEKPLLTIQSKPANELEAILAEKLQALPRAEQRQFLSLYNSFLGKFPFSGIFKTNALPCGSGSRVGGVYSTICLINHSCIPNSHSSWNNDAEHETIQAIRPIESGEEITISYDRGGPSSARQAFLMEAFGFECSCNGCSLPPLELEASDSRRLQIQRLEEAIGDPLRMMISPKESLQDCHSLIQALDEEFSGCPGVHSARLYYDAFQISVAHGDKARASIFSERAYNARVICEGEDSPETIRMKSLASASAPAARGGFGVYPMKWKTTREKIPKGLDTAQFENWLFGEQS